MSELSDQEKKILLSTARDAITRSVVGAQPESINIKHLPENLKQDGACFVTLTIKGKLRGCIGTMEPYQPLILDVQEHAVAAALSDYRFSPVRKHELPAIDIEISRLTPLVALPYENAVELCHALRTGIDGVLISAQGRRATFLPQVWEQLPTPEEFLSHLCAKMGSAPDFWKDQPMEVFTYQVEKFSELS